MNTPVILIASATSPAASATYAEFETAVREKYPDRNVYWGYPSRIVEGRKAGTSGTNFRSPAGILKEIRKAGNQRAIIQSLHLFPGSEFHSLQREVRQVEGIDCRIGLPLMSSPDDYAAVVDMLAPYVKERPEQAVVLIGHGTRHPVWTSYLAFENLLRRKSGPNVFVGVVEHYPQTDDLPESILAGGYDTVLLIPFFLVTGVHFRRDVIGDTDTSWRKRFEKAGLKVNVIHEGLGIMSPTMAELAVRHIQEAEDSFHD